MNATAWIRYTNLLDLAKHAAYAGHYHVADQHLAEARPILAFECLLANEEAAS